MITFVFITVSFSQSSEKTVLVSKYISLHENGSDQDIRNFIRETYYPEFLKIVNIENHIQFYKKIIKEFGPLNPEIYKITEQSPYRFVVYLIKKNRDISEEKIDPKDILVLELDQSKDNPMFLSKGLGLGSLVCEFKK